jgi:hypothetical protein
VGAPLAALEIVLGLIVFFRWPKRQAWQPCYLFPAVIFWSVFGVVSLNAFRAGNIAVELRDEAGSLLPNFLVQYHISSREESIAAMALGPLLAIFIDPYRGTKNTGQDGVLHLKAAAFQRVTLTTNSTETTLTQNSEGYTLQRAWEIWFPKIGFPLNQRLRDPLRIVDPRKSVVVVQTKPDDQGGMYLSDVQEIVNNIVAGKYTDKKMAPDLQNIAALNWIDEIVKGSRSNPALLSTLWGIASMGQDFGKGFNRRDLERRFVEYKHKIGAQYQNPNFRKPMSEKDYDDFVDDLKQIRYEYMWKLKEGLPSVGRRF